MTLMNCIERIPVKLREIAAGRRERTKDLPAVSRVVVIASGSSYNSAFAARNFMERECGLEVKLIYPNNFVNYTPWVDKEALYLFISQGGQTKLVYEALKLAEEKGCVTCAMTAERDCIIARSAAFWLDMGCGEEEYLYRTIGFSATTATCMMLGVSLAEKNGSITGKRAEEFEADLAIAAGNLDGIRKLTLDWYDRNRFSLLRRQTMLIAAAGDLWPIAQESDIKAMEMVPMMTKSYELEEFIHGPQNAFDDSMIFVLYSHEGEDEDKVRRVAAFLKKEIGFCAVVGAAADEEDGKDLSLPVKSRFFFPLEFITFMQVTAYKMADDRGRDLSRGVNASIKNYIQKTI